MKKSTVVLLVSAALVGAGILFAVLGIFTGASTQVSFGANGVRIGPSTFLDVFHGREDSKYDNYNANDNANDSRGYFSESRTIDAFHSADISLTETNIQFIASDGWKMEYRISDGEDRPEWSVENGVLKFSTQGKFSFFNFDFGFLTGRENDYLKIYYPEGSVFQKLKAHNVSGNITAHSIEAQELDLNTVSGNMDISGSDAAKLRMESTSGAITAENISSSEANFNSMSGNIAIQEARLGAVTANSISGSIKLTDSKATKCGLSTTSNNIYVDDSTMETLNVQSTSGNVSGSGVTLQGLTAGNVSGGLELEGKLDGNMELSTTSGNVFVENSLSRELFHFTLSSLSGDKSLNGDETESFSGNAAQYTVNANSLSGNIRLDFTGE